MEIEAVIVCPQCNKEANYASNTASGAYSIDCLCCGYNYERSARARSSLADREIGWRPVFGHLSPVYERESFGRGVIFWTYRTGQTAVFRIGKKQSPTMVEDFEKNRIGNPKIDPDRSYITRWDNESLYLFVVAGNAPWLGNKGRLSEEDLAECG